MNSRQKGARGEREAAAELARIGLGKSRRGRQYNGLEGRDVVCDALPGVHFEVKRTETFNAYAAMAQAQQDAGVGVLPIVIHKRNRQDWLFVVRADDLVAFAKAVSVVFLVEAQKRRNTNETANNTTT